MAIWLNPVFKVNFLLFAGVQITFLCCFYFLLQFHKMNVSFLQTESEKRLGPNCPFCGLNLPTVAGIIL